MSAWGAAERAWPRWRGPATGSTVFPAPDVVSGVREDAKLHAELPSSVRSSGTLILGTTIQPGTSGLPHAGQVNGENVGLDVDLRNAVAKVLGVSWNVQNGTFATIIPGVQNGKYQVGQDNFGATKEREQVVDFATYLNDGQGFLGSSTVSVSSISKITDACGYTIGTSPGSTFQTLLTSNASKCAAVAAELAGSILARARAGTREVAREPTSSRRRSSATAVTSFPTLAP